MLNPITLAVLAISPSHAAGGTTYTACAAVDRLGPCAPGMTCSLRSAIVAANASTGADTIEVCDTFPVDLRVTLGRLEVREALTIVGTGSTPTVIDGGDRMALIGTWADLSLENVQLQNARGDYGGAIQGYGATITLWDAVFLDNTARYGGGGILCYGGSTPGAVIAESSHFEGNVAGTEGGAIRCTDVSVAESTFEDNDANLAGGAISADGTVDIKESWVSASDSGDGGALVVTGATHIVRSTFSDNTAGLRGGAIWADGTVDLQNVTFDANHAVEEGGAIYAWEAAVDVNHGTFSDNSVDCVSGCGAALQTHRTRSGAFTVAGSILWGNTDPTGASDCAGDVTFSGVNIAEVGCGSGTIPLASNPALSSLGPDGGNELPVRPIDASSPARDASGTSDLGVDARRLYRDGDWDLGAYEVQP